VIFTRIVYPDKKPVSYSEIEGGAGFNSTDAEGYAQIELFADTKQLKLILPDNKLCLISLPSLPPDETLVSLPDFICQPDHVALPSPASTPAPSSIPELTITPPSTKISTPVSPIPSPNFH